MRVNKAIVSEYFEINGGIAKCKICTGLMKADRTNNLKTHAEKIHKIIFTGAKKKSKASKKQTEPPHLAVQKTKQEPVNENVWYVIFNVYIQYIRPLLRFFILIFSNSNHSFKAEITSRTENSTSPGSPFLGEEISNNSVSINETKYEVSPNDPLTSVVRFAEQLPDADLPTPQHDPNNSSNIYGMLIEARREMSEMANLAKETVLPHANRKTAAQTFFEGLAKQTDDARLSPQQFLNLQIAILKAFNKTLFDKN